MENNGKVPLNDLQKFKKANKARKEVLANRAGYATTDAYLNFLKDECFKDIVKKEAKKIEPSVFEHQGTINKAVIDKVKTDFKVDDIVTITQHYKVTEIKPGHLGVKLTKIEGEDSQGIQTDLNTLMSVFKSGDNFKYLEQKTRTELIEILENNKHSCMTVGYYKNDKEKSKAQYELEKQQRKEKVKSANLASVDAVLEDLIENPISKTIPGEYRIMRGYHYNTKDTHGYLQFIDADCKEEHKMRSINTRTINMVICDNTKYVLKK